MISIKKTLRLISQFNFKKKMNPRMMNRNKKTDLVDNSQRNNNLVERIIKNLSLDTITMNNDLKLSQRTSLLSEKLMSLDSQSQNDLQIKSKF